ncbi:hypothetical protein ACFQV2_24350 [Actinokineospora soli]|uniref:Uncharacterized protein n=1 Tax=Actinokineospora soli TaxID=1048753 RepID=A0ABW2TT13_9PSEU
MEGLTLFHRALEARRDHYNARFRMARHRSRSLSAGMCSRTCGPGSARWWTPRAATRSR